MRWYVRTAGVPYDGFPDWPWSTRQAMDDDDITVQGALARGFVFDRPEHCMDARKPFRAPRWQCQAVLDGFYRTTWVSQFSVLLFLLAPGPSAVHDTACHRRPIVCIILGHLVSCTCLSIHRSCWP